MKCLSCSAEIKDSASFCPYCGAKQEPPVAEVAVEAAQPSPASEPAPAPVKPAPQPVPQPKPAAQPQPAPVSIPTPQPARPSGPVSLPGVTTTPSPLVFWKSILPLILAGLLITAAVFSFVFINMQPDSIPYSAYWKNGAWRLASRHNSMLSQYKLGLLFNGILYIVGALGLFLCHLKLDKIGDALQTALIRRFCVICGVALLAHFLLYMLSII